MRIILTLGFEAPESWRKAFPRRTFVHRETGSEGLQLLREQGVRLAVVVFDKEFANDNPGQFGTLYLRFRKEGFQGEFLPNIGEERYILKTLIAAFYANASNRLTDKRVRSSPGRIPTPSPSTILRYLQEKLTQGDLVQFSA
ncbi:hypothetical protein K8Q93_00575 [Candidatus Parcubacteria bacterium]|nr:hypothetical protein [Candidatus Parcubacteria bacterium]